jgi:hypothetical protein
MFSSTPAVSMNKIFGWFTYCKMSKSASYSALSTTKKKKDNLLSSAILRLSFRATLKRQHFMNIAFKTSKLDADPLKH